MKTPRSRNGWVLVLVTLISLVVTGAGLRHVYDAQRTLSLRHNLYLEIQRNRALVQAKEVLERQVWALRATPRISEIAKTVLGMHAPKTDELLVFQTEEGND